MLPRPLGEAKEPVTPPPGGGGHTKEKITYSVPALAYAWKRNQHVLKTAWIRPYSVHERYTHMYPCMYGPFSLLDDTYQLLAVFILAFAKMIRKLYSFASLMASLESARTVCCTWRSKLAGDPLNTLACAKVRRKANLGSWRGVARTCDAV